MYISSIAQGSAVILSINTFIQQFLLTLWFVWLFNHYFASTDTNSSATAQDWLFGYYNTNRLSLALWRKQRFPFLPLVPLDSINRANYTTQDQTVGPVMANTWGPPVGFLHSAGGICCDKWLENLWDGRIRKVRSPNAVMLYVRTHGAPLFQSKRLVGT